jgi:hypothetical protein
MGNRCGRDRMVVGFTTTLFVIDCNCNCHGKLFDQSGGGGIFNYHFDFDSILK